MRWPAAGSLSRLWFDTYRFARVCDLGGGRSPLGLRIFSGLSDDLHDLRPGSQRLADPHRLLDLLDLFVSVPIDLVEILTKPIQKSTNLFRHPCHAEELVRIVDVLPSSPCAPAAEAVNKLPGLVCSDIARHLSQLLGAINQLSALRMLCLCCAVETLRIGQWPRAPEDRRGVLAGRHSCRRDRGYHLTPKSQQILSGPLPAPRLSSHMVWS
jgi:hypothetical protein